jgi:hypothetical protein
MASDIVKLSSINRMSGGSGSGEMTPHDRHAQAALIIKVIEKELAITYRAYVMLRYFGVGYCGNDESSLTNHLARVILGAMPTGMHSTRGIITLIKIYFGKNIGLSAIRCDFRCGNDKTKEYKKLAFDALDKIGSMAMAQAEYSLELAGIVEMDKYITFYARSKGKVAEQAC